MSAHAAGTVEVSFVEPARYSDAGRDPVESRRNEDTLARYLEGLGERYLAAGQTLKIDVLDLDLAGTVRPSRRGTGDIRIVRGGADAPHIRVRYSLAAGGQVVKSAEEVITDLNYLGHADRPDHRRSVAAREADARRLVQGALRRLEGTRRLSKSPARGPTAAFSASNASAAAARRRDLALLDDPDQRIAAEEFVGALSAAAQAARDPARAAAVAHGLRAGDARTTGLRPR